MADQSPAAVEFAEFSLWYGTFQAIYGVDLAVKEGKITSMIGPSGCGKSTLLRSVNRINERLGYVRTEGHVRVLGHDVYAAENSLVQVRKQVGMVFQRPNVLPLSIRDNILFGHRLHDGGKDAEFIVQTLRLPRALTAMAVGAAQSSFDGAVAMLMAMLPVPAVAPGKVPTCRV